MTTRRQFVQYTAALGALASCGPLMSRLAFAAQPLLQRKIPATGEWLPVIGLGTSQTFNADPESADMAPLREVLAAFVAGGAKVIDTAPSYGRAERVSGELVAQAAARDKVFLATKVSSTGREAGMRQIEASFKALRTDTIDLIQVHNLQDTRTQLALLRELKAQGRIRYIGVTHYVESAHDELLAVLKQEPVDFVQINYSIGARNAERKLLPYCADKGIATLINRTFEAGRLFAKVKGRAVPEWASAELDASSWAQLMLKFVLANPAVTAVIPATSQPRYVLDNLLAGQGHLPNAEQLKRIAAEFA
ncbi:aldo/keto reductase [Pseudomonas sp. RIT-PI-a]|uniref:aldo/keto reductase n=1 Tax=Pseudomonas sp. RIT-PI-a TaxID=1681194 RepID=UPI000675FE86|nr:aldo/keto reductase [Pseudomonas sp. RIT-PI-a]KNC16251.1 aldo/keto reductase [Pseudomonas sp. RIT-PI-a]